jgi:hypothetical protein
MLEICIAGFLVLTAPASILLWRALAVSKQADDQLQRMEALFLPGPTTESGRFGRVMPAGDD